MNVAIGKCCRCLVWKPVVDPLIDDSGRFHERTCMNARDGSARREMTDAERAAFHAWRESVTGELRGAPRVGKLLGDFQGVARSHPQLTEVGSRVHEALTDLSERVAEEFDVQDDPVLVPEGAGVAVSGGAMAYAAATLIEAGVTRADFVQAAGEVFDEMARVIADAAREALS